MILDTHRPQPKEVKNVEVRVIPHQLQRYQTVGDWFFVYSPLFKVPTLTIFVSALGNWKYEMLVALHEQHEALLCIARGILEKAVTDFDIRYERNRPAGDQSEPGDDPSAPYHKEHVFATKLELEMASQLGVDWDEYEKAIQEL